MIKRNWVYILFVFALILFIYTQFLRKKSVAEESTERLSLKTMQTGRGWGYKIYKSDTLLIDQPDIPAISGRKSFVSEEQAKIVGNLIISKLKTYRYPVVSEVELDSLGITR